MQGLPRQLSGEESSCQCRRPRFNPSVRKIPWRRKWQLQYSCLGNPMIRSAWQAAGHGFRESQTRPSSRAHTHVQGGNGSAFAPRTVTAQLRTLASFLRVHTTFLSTCQHLVFFVSSLWAEHMEILISYVKHSVWVGNTVRKYLSLSWCSLSCPVALHWIAATLLLLQWWNWSVPMRASRRKVWVPSSTRAKKPVKYVDWEADRGLTQARAICFASFFFPPQVTSILKTVAGHTEIQPNFFFF